MLTLKCMLAAKVMRAVLLAEQVPIRHRCYWVSSPRIDCARCFRLSRTELVSGEVTVSTRKVAHRRHVLGGRVPIATGRSWRLGTRSHERFSAKARAACEVSTGAVCEKRSMSGHGDDGKEGFWVDGVSRSKESDDVGSVQEVRRI